MEIETAQHNPLTDTPLRSGRSPASPARPVARCLTSACITFHHCTPSGEVSRQTIHGAAFVIDEPYPPGGMLRVIYDAAGRILAGPPVDEILSWEVA